MLTNRVAKMSIPELNAALHAIIAPPWPADRCRVCGWPIVSYKGGCTTDSCCERPVPARRADAPPDYCQDSMRRTLLAEIERRVLKKEFIACLVERTNSIYMENPNYGIWHLLTASAEQFARAALAVLQENKT